MLPNKLKLVFHGLGMKSKDTPHCFEAEDDQCAVAFVLETFFTQQYQGEVYGQGYARGYIGQGEILPGNHGRLVAGLKISSDEILVQWRSDALAQIDGMDHYPYGSGGYTRANASHQGCAFERLKKKI